MRKTYAYHKPSPGGLDRITLLRKLFSDLHEEVEATAPPSRERSIAFTHLEESAMWAIKSVVCNDADSVVDPDSTFGLQAVEEVK